MIFEPHGYQRYVIDYLETHEIAALLIDMGLGKTAMCLTAINAMIYDSFEVSKVLVVAPLRVAKYTWPDEIEKWDHLNGLTYSVAVGSAAQRMEALQRDVDIHIINRENVQWLIEESGLPFDYDLLVVDELSSFKNHQTKRFRSLMKVRPKVKRIIGLTGTPTGGGLMDLYALYRLLDMGQRLGRFITQYRNAYFTPDKRNGMVVYSYKLLPGAEAKIYEKISDITISMRAFDHLHMPGLIKTAYEVRLSDDEQKKYLELKKECVLELPDSEITAFNAASLSNKLLQLANGAIYDDSGGVQQVHDRKLDALEDIIESANGRSILVAYWFKHDLERIRHRLDQLHIPYETMDKSDSIRRWNAGDVPVGLIHPASAGHGLNLQSGGSRLVWFGMTWSLELYQQTIGRLWRQGQQAASVVIMHLIAKGTIDERIMKALDCKDEIQTALMEAVKAEVEGEVL